MPDLDGYETTLQVRQQEGEHRHIPIIALTAHALKEDRERCLAAGMDDFISKPYSRERLAGVLVRWLPQ